MLTSCTAQFPIRSWFKIFFKKTQHFILSQNFISTCRYLDDHCQYSSLFSYIKISWQRHSTEVLQMKEQQSDDKQRNTTIWTRTTSPDLSLQLESVRWSLGVRSSSLVNSMRRAASQMQEPEDDVTRVAAVELAGLIISLLFDEAGLVSGAAFCGRGEIMLFCYYCMVLSGFVWPGAMNLFRTRGQMRKLTMTDCSETAKTQCVTNLSLHFHIYKVLTRVKFLILVAIIQ